MTLMTSKGPRVPPMLRGSLVTLRRRCGKASCHCAQGDQPHEAPALSYSDHGRTRVVMLVESDVDAAELAQTYFDRWPHQENCIKDWLLDLGLDTNHGYAKRLVENSEVAKRRAELEKRLANAARWAQGARVRYDQATKRYSRFWKAAREREHVLYWELNLELRELEQHGVPEWVYRAEAKARTAAADAEVDALCQRAYKAHDAYRAEWDKCERYCTEQRALLRQLEDLTRHERAMHELDNRKDQVMTILKVALVNLAMKVWDDCFPLPYAHATWRRLAPFFRLPGRIAYRADTVHVELRPFNDRPLNRDLAAVCAKVYEAKPHLPDGRRLVFTVAGASRPILNVPQRSVA